ncbi:hypothetical protein [Novosphingobium sp. PASSN1]|uniref:hypothetical protein n=1 Tax=Novosphingobium sp. PASSN1 TaxID=2015561 RepID=UPI0025DF1EDB|nr:hypothetical protein [Novosphingobium sp. PASSN1]
MSDFGYVTGEFQDAGDWVSEKIMSSVVIGGKRLRNVYFDSPIIADIMMQARGDIVVGYTVWKQNAFLADFMELSASKNESKLETHLRHMKDGSEALLKDGRCNIFYIKDLIHPDDEVIVKNLVPSKASGFSFIDGSVINSLIFVWIMLSAITFLAFNPWVIWLTPAIIPIWLVYSHHLSPQARQYKKQIIEKLRAI